jgi:membrane-bound ClpP family serine protease
VATTVVYAATLWICVRKIVEVAVSRPIHELSSLIGQKGEARTLVQEGGSVQVAGELWSARSDRPLKAGSPVRVVGREGFVLVVESDPKQ